MKTRPLKLYALFMLFSLLANLSASADENVLSLNWVINEAIQNNPELQAAYKRWNSAKEKIPQARALDNPIVGYKYTGEEGMTATTPMQHNFFGSQNFPFFGKLRLKGEIASKEANIAEAQYNAIKRSLLARVKNAYYELYYVYKSIRINEENKDLLKGFEEIARTKYTTGVVTQQDVLKAQVEVSKIINELITLERLKETVVARLNSLLNRPPHTPLGVSEDFEPAKFTLTLDKLYQMTREISPELKQFAYDIEKNDATKRLAKKQYLPDFTVGVEYTDKRFLPSGLEPVGGGVRDEWAGTVSITVPLFQKQRWDAGVRQSVADLEASQRAYKNMENTAFFGVKDSHFRIQTAERLIELYKNSIIPQAEQSLKAAEIGYQTGKVDFLQLIDSQRVLLFFRLAYYRAVADFEQNFAELERIVGTELK
ncbi:MAG TPA: TolC family protein [Candidatus Brocadiia bacterium]|nr:TolC family protein [Candidatus Brocadiales bacterium]